MQNALQLSLSAEAKNRIAVILSEFRSRFHKEGIPALMWLDSSLNKGAIESQPAIGLYDDKDDIAPGDLLIVDGIEIAIAVADDDFMRFRGKNLDYESGRFALR